MKKIIRFLPFILGIGAFAQPVTPELISVGTIHASPGSVSVSWSTVEPANETYAYAPVRPHSSHNLSVNSVKESTQGGSVYAYPNPVNSDLTLDFHNMQSGTYQTEIFDVSGKLLKEYVLQIDSESFKEKIDMNNFDEGLYLFKVTNSSKSISKVFKITKQK